MRILTNISFYAEYPDFSQMALFYVLGRVNNEKFGQ